MYNLILTYEWYFLFKCLCSQFEDALNIYNIPCIPYPPLSTYMYSHWAIMVVPFL